MKLTATALLAACLCLPCAAATPPPQHGGLVVQSAGLELELVATPAVLRLYVRGQSPLPDLAKSRAQVTLRSGADQQVVALKPAGDRLEAAGIFIVAPGTQLVVNISTPGRASATAHYVVP